MADKQIKGWITVNGRHVPLYEKVKQEQIKQVEEESKAFDAKKKLDDLIVSAKKFNYTHEMLSPMYSRAQIFPLIEQADFLIKKLQKQLPNLDPNSSEYAAVYNELVRLRKQAELLDFHKSRIFSEIGGRKVSYNPAYFEQAYGPYGLYK